jgi:hypothetical protein
MQWIPPQEEHAQESRKQKTSSREEHDTTNTQVVAEKENYLGDPSKGTDQGKLLTCFFCGKPVHFAQDCRQKRYGSQGPPRTYPGQLCGNQPVTHARQTSEGNATQGVAKERTLQQ